MRLADLLTADRVLVGLRTRDKPALLAELARQSATHLALDPAPILAALTARERLGSTGFGRGFALPHARVEGVKTLFALFARLAKPVPYDAIDGAPVDLVVLLLIPPDTTDHVAALAAIARELRDEATIKQIRAAADASQLYQQISK
jgi:PTS system nitrogen regulatory IIA component